jgi:threonine dehydratase
LALAARWRGIPAFLVMPSNLSEAKIRAVESYGGKITSFITTQAGNSLLQWFLSR